MIEDFRVFIYKNLHNNKFSIKALGGRHQRKVIGYADIILLEDVNFKVNEKGRQRVLKTKCKSVHAGLDGRLIGLFGYVPAIPQAIVIAEPKPIPKLFNELKRNEITYNPYKYETFVYKEDSSPIYVADRVTMDIEKGVFEIIFG